MCDLELADALDFDFTDEASEVEVVTKVTITLNAAVAADTAVLSQAWVGFADTFAATFTERSRNNVAVAFGVDLGASIVGTNGDQRFGHVRALRSSPG